MRTLAMGWAAVFFALSSTLAVLDHGSWRVDMIACAVINAVFFALWAWRR